MGHNPRRLHRIMPLLISLLVNAVLVFCLVRLAAAPAAPRTEIAVELQSAMTMEDAPAAVAKQPVIPDFQPPAPPLPLPKPVVQQSAKPRTVEDILREFPTPPEPHPDPVIAEHPFQDDPPPEPPTVEVKPDPPQNPGNGGGSTAPANGSNGGGAAATGPSEHTGSGTGDGSGHGAPGGVPGGTGAGTPGPGDGSGHGAGKPPENAPPATPPSHPVTDTSHGNEAPPPPPPPPVVQPPAPKVVRQPTVTRKTEPQYPSDARREGVQGNGLLRVRLDAAGKVKSVEVITSTGDARLDDAAIREISTRWRFTPRYEDNTPVESSVKVPVEFRLNR